jgi:hypothetical protein
MEWIVLNWWWISPIVIPLMIGGIKYAAYKTPWVWDDKIATLISGIYDMSRGKEPRNVTGKKR